MLRTTLLLMILTSCTLADAKEGGTVPSPSGPGCLADADESGTCPTNVERNVLGTELVSCSTEPMTGFFRDGSCRTGPQDRGVHVVCASMTQAFLEDTRARGNDLVTPSPGHRFPGLKPGDRWCLCAARWEEARQAGLAPPVILEATAAAAVPITSREALKTHAQR